MRGDFGRDIKVKRVQVFDVENSPTYHLVFTHNNESDRFEVRCSIWTGESDISDVFGVPDSSLAKVAVISADPGGPGESNYWHVRFQTDKGRQRFLKEANRTLMSPELEAFFEGGIWV